MLTQYQLQLRAIRNKQIPTNAQSKKQLKAGRFANTDIVSLSYQLLLNRAQLVFNAWIRKRDRDKGCVSCKSKKVVHASHFYSAGSFLGLRFHEHNAHGSCEVCNTFLYGNLEAYRKQLIIRIGSKALRELDLLAMENKRKKYTRTELLEIIRKYKV